jgi:Domain of unknown function (DUF4365)
LLPQPIVQELLSIAHLQAVAAQAGISVATFDRLWRKRSYRDFGVDGHFRKIAIVEDRRFTYGYGLDFQLKSSVNCVIEELHIRYDLEAKTYNDLVRRSQLEFGTPCILLLKALPADRQNWLTLGEDGLLLGGNCYWHYLQGELSSNQESVRIRIPKTQQFTPDTLMKLMDTAANYVVKGVWS